MFRESTSGGRLIHSTPSQEGAVTIVAQEPVEAQNRNDPLRRKMRNDRF
jgi:hypothetical protein